jgi:hypothetical protein
MTHLPMRESDLRSLNRKGMYSIFGPLDPNERLPRELLYERPAARGISLLASRHDRPGRPELAVAIWLPAMLLLLMAAGLGRLNGVMAFGVAVLLAIGLIGFALSGDRARS